MSEKHRSVILGMVAIFCWGSLATFGALLVHLPPFYVLGSAFLFGGLPALIRFRELFTSWKVFLWGVFGYFGYHFFLFYSFRFAPAIEANLINYLWPVLMVLLTPVFIRGERLRWFHIMGSALSVVGCVFLMLGKGGVVSFDSLKGYGLAFLAALTWPIYSIGKKLMGPVSVWAVGGFCLGASLLCFLTHFWLEPRVVLQLDDGLKLLAMGIGPFGVAFYAWDLAMRRGNPKIIGALAYLTPVISTAGLVLFGNQMLNPSSWLAMGLIIAGASAGLLDFLPSKR